MIEIVYTWPGGREEVRYRRPTGPEADKLIAEVEALKARLEDDCPYSYRSV